jgi:hypothetical protein
MQPAQTAFAHLYLNCEKIIIIKIKCRMKLGLNILACGKNTISYQYMAMDVGVEITAEAVTKATAPNLEPTGASGLRCRTVVSTARRKIPPENHAHRRHNKPGQSHGRGDRI